MATRTANNKTYYINPAYLTFVENSGYGANLIQVSASSSCYISVYDPANGINYSDADKNYLRWKVTAYNNKFPDNEAWKIYVRLERDGSSALVMYDHDELGIHGGKIEEKTDEQGNVTKVEGEYDPNHPYWYIRIGDVSATNGTTIREITYDTGYLVSDRGLNDANDLNDMWELDKYSTPWLIRAKQWLSDFTVKGFVTLIGGLVFKKGDVEKPVVDIKRSTDDDVPVDDTTIPTTAYVRSISDDRYLKKYEEDETNYRIRFYDGIEAGHFVKGMIGGSGTQFDGRGYGEMNGLTLREFLEVPELRFNRIDVVSGELWNSIAFGLVESVDTGRRICRIKLEGKERCGLHVYDICRGIFADFGDGTQWEGVDECGFLHLYGFWTSYFTPTKILENGDGVFSFQYELKAGATQHPCQSMKFAVYGNFVDSSRQASAYSTRTYKRYLNKVDTWVIDPDKHIYAQYGDLEGLTVGGMHMHGYGSFQSNSYFTGVQIQFTPQQKLELQGESAYSVILSDYEGVVIIDDEGNVIGGETEMLNVVSDGMNVTSSGDNVVTSFYKLRTEVQAMRGSTPLFHSPSTPSEGAYAIAINTVGCTAVVINGVVAVTSVFHTERCYVDIVVNCEGKATFSLRYNINAVRDGKNPVIADIDNEMDSVACDSAGKVLFGLPVSCTVSMWAGVKKLVLDRLVLELPDGVTATSDRSTGLVTVTGITDEAERTLPVNITAYATHGGNQYHKELVFTVNKVNAGENALLYKLSPSASSVKVDDEGNMTASSISCEVVASDGRRIEPLEELPQGVTMEFFRDDEVAGTYSYKTPVSINDGNKTVTFRLLVEGKLVDVETIPILIDGSSPVSLDLDNEMFSVACDAGGDVTFMPEMVTRATMYWGSKALATEVTSVESKEGAVSSFVGDTVTVTSIPEGKDTPDTFRIAVSAKAAHGGTEYTRTAYLTVNKVRQGDSAWVLDLLPSVSAVKVNNKGVYSPISVSCRTRMTTGKEVSVPAALQDNYTMRYSVDGGSETSYSYGDEIAVSPEYDKEITALSTDVTFYLYHSEDNGKEKPWVMVDKETIPILMDAADAFKSTVFIRTNDVPDTPTGGSYESPVPGDTAWSDGIPAGEEILWASTRTFTSDGKEPQDDVWSTPAQMTDTASFDVEYSSVRDNPGNPTDNPSNWSNVAGTETVWMATRIKTNGAWSDWQVSKIKGEKGDNGSDAVSSFKSTVFYRSNSEPSVPEGGSYSSPKPTSAPEWSDGIPAGEEILWASTRIFTSDGSSPQQPSWSVPRQMTDTASVDIEFSSVEVNPGNPTDNPSNWSNVAGTETVWMATRIKTNGAWSDWQVSKVKGEKGDDAVSSFKSTVFYRSNSEPSVPEGGSYSSPKPTSAPEWSDGIPAGEEILWASTRIFTSDGSSPQQPSWSVPRQMTDTASVDIEFSSVEVNPGNPTDNPSNWSNVAGTETVWMATRIKTNGAWSDWQVSKVKGEKGDAGAAGKYYTQIFISSVTVPETPEGNSEEIPSGWSTSVPEKGDITCKETYSGEWTNVGEYRKSPKITSNGFTKEQISFTVTSETIIEIRMTASSEANYDFGYIGQLDTSYSDASSIASNYLERVSGTESVSVYLSLTAGTHYIEVVYTKDGSSDKFEDCIRYKVYCRPEVWMSKAYTEPTGNGTELYGTWSNPIIYLPTDGTNGKDGENAMYYEIKASVGSIGYSSLGYYSPSSFVVSEYTINGGSRTPSNKYYIHIYGLKGDTETYLTYSSSVNQYRFDASAYIKSNYDSFRFDLRTSSSASSSLVAVGTSITVPVAKDGSNEAAGSMPYNCGEYSSTSRYYYNADRRDIVTYEGGVYMVKSFDADGYISGYLPTNSTYWTQASQDIFRAMDTALIDGANIAGFTFKNNVMLGGTDINNPTLKLDGINGEITALKGYIGGFTIGNYTLVNDGIGADSLGYSNKVSLTPYDMMSVGHTSGELIAMSGGVSSVTNYVTGFSAGIKSRIRSTSGTGTSESYFATLGGFFEGTSTSGNRGAVGVWGKALYSSGSPYIMAGVVGTEINATLSSYTKAQAGVFGYSTSNYGMYADGGKYGLYARGGENDIYLANSSIGNFGLGGVTTYAPNNSSYGVVSGVNVFMANGAVTLPSLSSLPAGRMILVINNTGGEIKVSPTGTDKIRTTMSDKESYNDAYTTIHNRNAMFFISLYPTYQYWYGFKGYDQ